MRPSRLPAPLALSLLVAGLPARAAAQSGPEANLVLTAAAGVVTGGGLWTVGRQPFCSKVGTPCMASEYDTLRLTRATSSSLTVGASVTYFPSPVLGFHGEITYLGFPLSDGCTVLNAGATRPTQQICNSIQGHSSTSGAIAFFAGVIARATPRRAISPYVRGGVGLVTIDQSTIDVSGADSTGQLYGVLIDEKPKHLALGAVLGAGFTFSLGPGYQFRIEGLDVVSSLARVARAADATLRPPVQDRVFHHFALTMGLDVVLEHKRGRRY